MDDARQDLDAAEPHADGNNIGLSIGQWRKLAIAAAIVALLWSTISMAIVLAGGPNLNPYIYSVVFPNIWLVAFALGFLLARTEAVHLAGIGALISTFVAIAVHLRASNAGMGSDLYQLYYSGSDDQSPSIIVVLVPAVLPWLWIAVMIGIGAFAGQRWRARLGLAAQ